MVILKGAPGHEELCTGQDDAVWAAKHLPCPVIRVCAVFPPLSHSLWNDLSLALLVPYFLGIPNGLATHFF